MNIGLVRLLLWVFISGLAFGASLSAGAQPIRIPGFEERAVPGAYAFRTYGSEAGRDSASILHLAQDRDGYLWLGSDSGLYCYDGQRFHRFGRAQGLKGENVGFLWADPKGGVWAGFVEGVNRLEGLRVTPPERFPQGFPNGKLRSLARDGAGRLWVTSKDHGTFREDASGRMAQVSDFSWPRELVWAPRHQGMFMLGPDRLELWRDGKAVEAWTHADGLPGHPESLLEDAQGRLWMLDQAGLSFKPLGARGFNAFPHPAVRLGGEQRWLTEDGQGGLWVATAFGLLHIQGGTWTHLSEAEGLPTRGAETALVDREGSLWYASGGLYRQLGKGSTTHFDHRDGLPSDLVWSLCRDAKGRLWAGCDNGLAVMEGTRWRSIPATEGRILFAIVGLPDGSVVGSGPSNQILHLPPGGGRPRFLSMPGDTRTRINLRLIMGPTGKLWVVGRHIWRVDLRHGHLEVLETLRPPVPEQDGSLSPLSPNADPLEGRDGTLWIASPDGLLAFDHGVWRKFTVGDGLAANRISSLSETASGDLLISYWDGLGLTRARLEGGRLNILQQARADSGALPTDTVFSTRKDASGRIWLSTNRGAVLWSPKGFQGFGAAWGFPSSDMVQQCFHADPDGVLWMGTSLGLVRLDTRLLDLGNPPAPKAVLAQCLFGGKPLAIQEGMRYRIRPQDNTLEVLLGNHAFSREGAFAYEVRLEGLEPDWRLETTPKLRYAALPPGSYTLMVRTRWDGRAGEEARLAFEVLPRWYQSLLFQGFLLAMVPILAGFGLRWRTHRLAEKAANLERLVQTRTQELEAANQALEEQSLRDPLTGLHNRRYLNLTLPGQLARIQRDIQRSQPTAAFLADHPLVFFLLDIDHFKHVNDEYGHDAGDQVLKHMARILGPMLREGDSLVRWGGEEFLIAARQVGHSDPSRMAERIRRTVAEHPFSLDDGRTLSLSISIGFCPYPIGHQLPAAPWEKAVMLADRGLYAAKRSGRNGWIGLTEGPAFAPECLLVTAASPDIPDLLARGVLHIAASFEEIPGSAWI